MKKKVDVIICNTNMAVPTTLSYVMENPKISFVILSDTQNIISLFESLSLKNCQVVKYSNYSSFFSIARKRELMKRMRPYRVEKLFFFHFDYGDLANWYLKQMANQGQIFFCKLFNRKPYIKDPFKSCYKKLLVSFLHYGVWMDCHDGGILSAPTSFYRKIKSKEIDIPIRQCLIKQIAPLLGVENGNVNTLLLSGSLLSRNIVDEEVYDGLIAQIVNYIGADTIAVKCHPRFNDLSNQERKLMQLPSFIPGNLLVFFYDNFIGYDSLLLVEAARSGKKSLSILNLIPTRDKLAKERSMAYLEERLEGKATILYPNSFESLVGVL